MPSITNSNVVVKYSWFMIGQCCNFQGINSRGGSRGGGRTRPEPPLKWEKKRFFWRKIVIFHTKYPKNFRAPSARRNFFKCAPPLLEILDPPLNSTVEISWAILADYHLRQLVNNVAMHMITLEWRLKISRH